MVEAVYRDYKYEYVCALCEAIEAYTNAQEALNPNAYLYRGANLKYVIERILYFSCADSKRLSDFYQQWKQGELLSCVEVGSDIELSLALWLCDKSVDRNVFKLLPVSKTVVSTVCSLKRRLKSLFWGVRKSFFSRTRSPEVLFYVIHEKFVRFFRPLTGSLECSYAYLLVQDALLKDVLVRTDVPFIDFNRYCSWSVYEKSDELSQFGEYLELFDCIYESLTIVRPKCVVVAEGNAPQNELINQVVKLLSIPVVCVQQGWSPIIHNGFRHMSFDKFLAWGEGFSTLLRPFNPDQKFFSVGNYIVEQRFSGGLAKRLNGCKAVCFFLQSPTALIGRKNWDLFLELVAWTAKSFPQKMVLVREHPGYALAEAEKAVLLSYKNVYLVPPKEFVLSEVLCASDFTVSIYSSTILESIAYGVFPIIFNPLSLPRYSPDVHRAGAGIEVKDIASAQKVITEVIAQKESLDQYRSAMRLFRNEYFSADKGSALRATVEAIQEVFVER